MKLFRIVLLAVLFVACSRKEPELRLLEQSVVMDYPAGTWLTMVTSGGDWTLSSSAPYDWITPSNLQGKVGEIITFGVQANLTGSPRSAQFRVQSGSQVQGISIRQEAKPEVQLPPSKGAYKHVVILGVDGAGAFVAVQNEEVGRVLADARPAAATRGGKAPIAANAEVSQG